MKLTPRKHLAVLTMLSLFSCVAIGWHAFRVLLHTLHADALANFVKIASTMTGLALPLLLIHFAWMRSRKYTMTPVQDFYFWWLLAPLSLIPIFFYYLYFLGLFFPRPR